MIKIGCHLSAANGYVHMAKEAISIGADTFAFFTRNPRGGKSKEPDPEDLALFRELWYGEDPGSRPAAGSGAAVIAGTGADEDAGSWTIADAVTGTAAAGEAPLEAERTKTDIAGTGTASGTGSGRAPLVAHAPYTLNLCSAKEYVREFSREAMREDLERLEALPGNYYNIHPGSHVGQGTAAGTGMIASALNGVMMPGMSTVVLLETMAGKGSEIGGSFGELAAIIDLIDLKDNIGVCLDTCHVSDGGYDIINDLDGVLEEFDRTVGIERLKALHINDSKNPPGSRRDRHEKIGEGHIGQDAFARIVTHPLLKNLPMILETPNDLEGYAEEIRTLKEMAGE